MNGENKSISKFQLDERVALITGSTRGIGWEIAKGMAEAGASVYINGRVKVISLKFKLNPSDSNFSKMTKVPKLTMLPIFIASLLLNFFIITILQLKIYCYK